MVERVECVVVGAGVVGLAVARALAMHGHEVLVLEAECAVGTQTSARSSEVIHAGLYYPAGSFKAELCVRGRQMLYEYCVQRSIGHRRCGKLLVATQAQQFAQLQRIAQQARANGVLDLQWLDADQAQRLESQLACSAALLSPSTGIVDSHALMLSLQGDLERAGGMVALRTRLDRVHSEPGAFVLRTQDGTELQANAVVNAAGLGAVALAQRIAGLDAALVPQAFFAKGSYFTLAGRAPFTHLIYPIPEDGGLGVHLTLDLGGQARFGPDVQWVESAADLQVEPDRADAFAAAVRCYWPALPENGLQPGYAGMRPKINGPGQPSADFLIQGREQHGVAGLVNLFGIESPGLTSALAIAEHVAGLLD